LRRKGWRKEKGDWVLVFGSAGFLGRNEACGWIDGFFERGPVTPPAGVAWGRNPKLGRCRRRRFGEKMKIIPFHL